MTGLLQRLVARAQGTPTGVRSALTLAVSQPPSRPGPVGGLGGDPLRATPWPGEAPTGDGDLGRVGPEGHKPFAASDLAPGSATAPVWQAPAAARETPRARAATNGPNGPAIAVVAAGRDHSLQFRSSGDPGPAGSEPTPSPPESEGGARAEAPAAPEARGPEAGTEIEELLARLQPLLPAVASSGPALPLGATAAAISTGSAAADGPAEATSEVHVHIGRIEVTAVQEMPAKQRAPRERPGALSLEAYLARRRGGAS